MANIRSTSKELNPSKQTVRGLNALLFFIADVRHGIGPLLAIYLLNSLHWNPAKIGTALALAEFGAFLSQIPSGLIIDAARAKRTIILIACCIIIFGCLVFLFFPYVNSIMATQLMMGISIALIPSAIGAMTLGLFGRKKLPVRISQNEIWNHAGNLFIMLTIGTVSYLLGNEWIFYTIILFSLASMLSLSFIRSSEIHYEIARELPEENSKDKAPYPISKLLRTAPIIIFNLSLILYYVANGAQMTLLGQMLSIKNPSYASLYIPSGLMIAEMTMIGVAYIMSKIVTQFGRKTFFLTAFLILPVRAILYTLFDHPIILLSIQLLDGAAAGILAVIGVIINSDLAVGTGRFNFLQGLGFLSISIGEAMSQLSAGHMANLYGYPISFFYLASVGLIGSFFVWLLMPETKR